MARSQPFKFMSQSNQEFTVGRIHPAQFDCELPNDVRAQLGKPKRPRILGRQLPVKTTPRWPFYVVLAISLLALGGAVTTLWRQQERERASSTKAISQPLTPQPTPAPTPVSLPPGNASRWRDYLANNPPAAPRATLVQRVPRAQLVKLPTPGAQIVRPALTGPPLVVGRQYLADMPYGLELLATFRGWLPSQDDLPSHRNAIGDMWVVGRTPWVWIWTPGAARADWIDP